MDKIALFLALTKVDAEQRLVYGRAAQEVADKSNEIMDYESSKPEFQKWSSEFSKNTEGKSLGNIRAMHGKVAAGKIQEISFDDENKAIDIVAKIVDDGEWQKVQEGVYTGFSIGGSYKKRWQDAANPKLRRYTAEPSEISIVDNPCMPSATFTMVKADGIEEQVEFKTYEAKAEAAGEEVAKAQLEQVWKTPDGETFAKKTDALSHMMDNLEGELDKRNFSDKERKAAAKAGEALPDGSYPIKNKEDLGDAIKAYGRGKDKAAVKRHIIKRARALGAMDMLPEDWNVKKVADIVTELRKNEISDAAQAVCALQLLQDLLVGETLESEVDEDQIAALTEAIEAVKEFVASEIKEGTMAEEGAEAEKMAKAAIAERDEALQKIDDLTPRLEKALERIEKLEAQPQAAKGTVRVLDKETDSQAAGQAAEIRNILNKASLTPEQARSYFAEQLAKIKNKEE